jgi:tetratricopeptide (TPR) repeat protein
MHGANDRGRRAATAGALAGFSAAAAVTAILLLRPAEPPEQRSLASGVAPRVAAPPSPVAPLPVQPAAPSAFEAEVARGDAAYDRGEHAAAIPHYTRALAQHDSAAVRTNLGVSLHAVGRSDEALAEFSRARRLDPSYWKAAYNELVILANRQRYEAALERVALLEELRKTNAEIPSLEGLEAHLRRRAGEQKRKTAG